MDSQRACADNPDVLDTIFASAFVVGAARVVLLSAAIVLLFGGIYIAASTVHRMRHRQWLYRAGPFEAHLPSEAKEEIGDVGDLLRFCAEAAEENERLIVLLAERDQLIEVLERQEEG